MTRLSQRLTQQEALAGEKKGALDLKETAYESCMAR
jgi:hypothetical protein